MKKISLAAPVAPKFPQKFINHKDIRIDDYFWLRDRNHPETMKYLHAENKYFDAQMKPLQTVKNKLFKEMKARIKLNDSSVPAEREKFKYFSRYKKGLQYLQYVRKSLRGGREEIYLDGNVLAKGKKFFHLSNVSVSEDETRLAYGVDFDGSERYTLHLKDLTKGRVLKDQLKNATGSCVWSKSSDVLYYVVMDAQLRPYRVYRHKVGQDQKQDQLVYEEQDSQFFVHLYQSQSRDYIYIYTGGKVTSEVWYLAARDDQGKFKCFEKRQEAVEYHVYDRQDEFWIHTNYRAQNFQIMKASSACLGKRNWHTVIKNSTDVLRTGLTVFADHLIISEREAGLPQIRVYEHETKKSHVVAFKDAAYDVRLSANLKYKTETLRLEYSSPITPDSVLDYHLGSRKFTTLKVKEVKGHKPSNYICQRVWVRSHDGVKVPLTLVYKKGHQRNGKKPGYLFGYGSYGMSIPDAFPAHRDVYRLIDRGFVYALAHPRGGSELGRAWYENGKFLKKKNTFLDFIACGDYLIKNKWVASDKLAACGGSAGGMLMGACMNMRPDLFSVVAAHVPFVDVINTMFDKDLPLTQIEYKEWGNPADKKYYHYIKSYSPYDNVEKKAYPHLFITCGLNDPRVTYWEPAKWAAKLRDLKTDNHTLVFKTNMGAGHFGASGRFDHLWEMAEEYAFILNKFSVQA